MRGLMKFRFLGCWVTTALIASLPAAGEEAQHLIEPGELLAEHDTVELVEDRLVKTLHNGAIPAFQTLIGYEPQMGTTIVVFANNEGLNSI